MVGRAPHQGGGYALQDSSWLNALAGGDNYYTQTVTAIAGGGQANATPMGVPNAQGIEAALVMIGTVVTAADSVALPQAVKGRMIAVFNSSANSANVFASAVVNKVTGALDTLNALTNPTAYAMAGGSRSLFFCPADGKWASVLSA